MKYKKRIPKVGYWIAMALMFFACEGDTIELSEIPEIELISITPATVKAQQDSIVFDIQYMDGNGDLGTNDEAQRNVFITDKRINLIHEFRLQQLAPDGAKIPIQGSFKVFLENTLLTGSGGQENVSFSIYVKDRAGNESNVVESPEIVIVE